MVFSIESLKSDVNDFVVQNNFVNLNNMSATEEQGEWADCHDGRSRTHVSGVNMLELIVLTS